MIFKILLELRCGHFLIGSRSITDGRPLFFYIFRELARLQMFVQPFLIVSVSSR